MLKARKQSSGGIAPSSFSQMMASVGNHPKTGGGETTQYSEDLGSSYKSGLMNANNNLNVVD